MNGKIEILLSEAGRQEVSEKSGASSVSRAERTFETETAAKDFFLVLKRKILQVPEWESNSALSGYNHFDANGAICDEKPLAVGDFIRIGLPGSGKYDWIKIIKIDDSDDEFVLTVQPSNDPTEKTEKTSGEKTVSHFFTDESTNNFCLQLANKTIHFYVIGLNEKTNTNETGGIIETVRNVAASNIGHYLGIQKTEWTKFAENFLELKKHD